MTLVEARKVANGLRRSCTADGCGKRITKQRMINAFVHVGREAQFCSQHCAERTSARARFARWKEKKRTLETAPMQDAAGTLVPLPPIDPTLITWRKARAS